MYIPDYYEFCCTVNIVAGHDALEKIPVLLSGMGTGEPMILTDKGVRDAGLVDIVINAIQDGLSIKTIEDNVPPDSDMKIVQELAQVYTMTGCDSIVAIGGGSVLDTAKGINILVSEQSTDLKQFTGAGALKRKLKPLIAVPTTAGTGSEVTMAAVIADPTKNRKMLFGSHFLLPDHAIIDSRMTLTLPAHITAATAMDAMAHSVEACVMLSKNPISDAFGKQAIRMITNNLLNVITHPDDKDSRLALAVAATMAGISFSNSHVGMVHALGHSFGSVCHIPHGNCMAILLPYGLEYNLHKVEDRIADLLFSLAGPEKAAQTPHNKRAKESIETIRDLNRQLNQATNGMHATCFKEVKDRTNTPMVPRENLSRVALTAMGDGMVFYNPEDVDFDDWLMVAEASWEGIPLDLTLIKKG